MAYYIWQAPLRGQYKVNVHVLHTSRQLNDNNNGVGVIIRNHKGRLVRGFSGTMRGLSLLATQLWALYLGLNQARIANCEIVMLETDNFNPYFEVTRKDGRGDRTCSWIVEQINKLLAHNPEWANVIKYVADSANRVAHYLAMVAIPVVKDIFPTMPILPRN